LGCSNEVTGEDSLCYFCQEAGCQPYKKPCLAKDFQGLRRWNPRIKRRRHFYQNPKCRRKLTPQQRTQIAEICKDKSIQLKDIAQWFGIALSTASNICREAGYRRQAKSKRKTLAPPQRAQVVKLCKDPTIPQATIAQWFGIDTSTVSQICKKGLTPTERASVQKARLEAKLARKKQQRAQIEPLCGDKSISYTTIARWFGINKKAVARICEEAGHYRSKKQLTPYQRTQIIELCKDKSITHATIAKLFNVHETTISFICRKAGYLRGTPRKKPY
jgi:DNA invertase Pin-like site-specific DNA recombinase